MYGYHEFASISTINSLKAIGSQANCRLFRMSNKERKKMYLYELVVSLKSRESAGISRSSDLGKLVNRPDISHLLSLGGLRKAIQNDPRFIFQC